MKNRFLLLFLFAFITISACKCEYIPTLKSSFEKADFVFIGEIEGITEVPSGFKTSQDILSKVRINKIYKSDYYNEFYKETATLFASPLRSCDVPFTEKGRFLIFAYFEEDTGLLYSSHCLLQKRMDQLSPGELKELETLSRDYKRVPENSQITTGGLTELIDDPSTPNRKNK